MICSKEIHAFYETARDLIGHILTSGKASDKTTFEFLSKTKGARFLIGKDLAHYFDEELYRQAILLQTLDSELEGVGVGTERSENVRRQSEIKKWFNKQYEVLDEKFAPLLELRH